MAEKLHWTTLKCVTTLIMHRLSEHSITVGRGRHRLPQKKKKKKTLHPPQTIGN